MSNARTNPFEPGDAAISVITFGELLFDAEKSERRERGLQDPDEFASVLPVLPLPENAARTYGAVRARLAAGGRQIGGNDLWIAAHARSAGLILVTNNERDFSRVAELRTDNWVR